MGRRGRNCHGYREAYSRGSQGQGQGGLVTAKDEFRKSLAEELVKAGRKNTEISSPGDAGRKEAMENLAGAFADPVGEYVEKEMAIASAGLRSSDGTVDITPGTEGEMTFSDLSVKRAIAAAKSEIKDIKVIGDTLVITGF